MQIYKYFYIFASLCKNIIAMEVIPIRELKKDIFTAFIFTEENLKSVLKLLEEFVGEKIDISSLPKDTLVPFGNKYMIYKLSTIKPVEDIRNVIHQIVKNANKLKEKEVQIVAINIKIKEHDTKLLGKAFGEIPFLSNYQFLKYVNDSSRKNTLERTYIHIEPQECEKYIEEGAIIGEVVCAARDMVNEPPNVLTARELARRALDFAEKYGLKARVFAKDEIVALGMGGLLAVNRGSEEPPRFIILEWKPEKHWNEKPIVLIGKGLTFDTGGLNLKGSAHMKDMKCDMGGAASAIGTIVAAARLNLPTHIITLVPSTDNRPGRNAYTPNDVIRMYDGTTVEVRNTDAEGRMVLADAHAYAKHYDPMLVINYATLTGSAVTAVGEQTIAMFSNASKKITDLMLKSGFRTYERMVQFPLWKEYKEKLKSTIADLKNIGARGAGAITAAKFLEHFTDYPWIHLDIAGPAFLSFEWTYRTKEATGVGIRLTIDFLEQLHEHSQV